MKVRRFLRTPKGLVILVLAGLLVLAALGAGVRLVLPGVVAAVVAATVVDAIVLRVQKNRWVFPDGALLTGLIVAMILSPHGPWYVGAITSVVGLASKYAFRIRTANVFNPAALGLVATFYVFHAGQSWWGSLPELPIAALAVLGASGVFVAARTNKIPVVLAFLGVHFLLFTIAAFLGDPARVVDLYRAPDLHAALYFAFFMATDPPTSPPGHRDQLLFGAIAASVSFAAFEMVGAAYFMLAGLLAANVWEAWRRVRARTAKARHATPPLVAPGR